MTGQASFPDDEVQIRRAGHAARITLNRPARLNALTLGMVRSMTAAVDGWAADESVSLLVIDGAGERGLCAGGDIRALHTSARTRDGFAETFWREEYQLIGRIARFPKPVVAIGHGLVMGGGVGLTAHASHRVVADSTRLAMPEVGIGLIPDVGGTGLFARAPGETGTYLALTGEAVGPADIIALGLGDLQVAQARIAALGRRLEELPPGSSGATAVSAILAEFAVAPEPARLLQKRAAIDELFSHDTIEDILAGLSSSGTELARGAREKIERMSPTSLKVTLAAIRRAGSLASLEDVLNVEYRLVCACLRHPDFAEGVRAAVIDKDRSPRWNPSRLEDVSPSVVEDFFEGGPNGDRTAARELPF